jgi:prophage regulatory protein
MSKDHETHDRLIDRDEVSRIINCSISTISRMEARGIFPRRIHVGPGRIGWSLNEVLDWIEFRKADRTTVHGGSQ